MKALKIEPGMKPKLIDIENDLDHLQDEVQGYFQILYPFDDPVAILCNDEGKILHMQANRALRSEEGEIYDIICGDFLIVGLCEDDFMDLTPELIEKYKAYYADPECFIRYGHGIAVIRNGSVEVVE